ncbi:UNVERIFIED_CONTAM: hypothetical protein GTU68_057926, partial [Idotea baltica]|nr:hypothetical protein [Idotea baltica]
YEQSTGENAVKLAKIHEKVAKETGASLAVAVSPVDVFRVASEVSIPVFSQHVDGCDYGKFTGHILPQAIKKAGGIGSLINHSERRLEVDAVNHATSCAQKASLCRVICAENPDEVEELSEFDPDFIAFEPPELIGSTTASVASESPDSIAESVTRAKGIPLLVGAGINCKEDVEVSLKLGAQGFLVATAVVKAKDPEKALRMFVEAMS